MGSLRKAATERKAVRQERTAYCGTGHQRWQEPPILGQVRPGGGAAAAPAAPSVTVVAALIFFFERDRLILRNKVFQKAFFYIFSRISFHFCPYNSSVRQRDRRRAGGGGGGVDVAGELEQRFPQNKLFIIIVII